MIDSTLISKVKTLSPADKLELIGAVWETLSPNDTPITEQEKALIDARLQDMESNPDDQSSWSEVKERLKSKLS